MKSILNVLIAMLIALPMFSQEYLALNEQPKKKVVEKTGTVWANNYQHRNVYEYIGETLRFKCDSRYQNSNSGFVLGFTVGYKIGKDEYGFIYPKTYQPKANGVGTDYDKIVGNLFKVLSVHPHPWAGKSDEYNNVYYLELYNLNLRDTAYYEYISGDDERFFPFLVTEHIKYLRRQYRDQFYQVIGEQNEYVEVTNYKTKEGTQIFGKSWWKCVNIVNEDCELSLVLERKGTKIIIPMMYVKHLLKKV